MLAFKFKKKHKELLSVPLLPSCHAREHFLMYSGKQKYTCK